MFKKPLLGLAIAVAAASSWVPRASAQDLKPITVSAIGRPPIFAATFADLGGDLGFWKAVGLDIKFRWFQLGADTAKAVLTGDVAVSYTGTQPALNLIAAGAPIVAIAGQPNQDFFVASDEPGVRGCADLKGKTVASDGIGNARYLYLTSLLATCGLKMADVTTVALNNAALVKASIADQVHSAVFHIDELAQVEFAANKKFARIATPEALENTLHYVLVITTKKQIEDNREGLIRFLEGWILTQNMMSSKDAATRLTFAMSASRATGSDFQVALNAIGDYQAINYWVNEDGLDQQHLMGQLDRLVEAGTIKPANKPTFERIVDRTLYAEAMKRVRSKYGLAGG